MATRKSLRYLTAALVAGLAFCLTPTAPVQADEDPGVRAPRMRAPAPRVRAPVRTVHHVRTVVRTRVVYVPQPVYTGCGSCAPAPQPIVYRPAYTTCGGCASAPTYYAPTYYAPRYDAPRYQYTGCSSCGQSVAAPYGWTVRYARYRHAHRYY